jgi:hypothetical protein
MSGLRVTRIDRSTTVHLVAGTILTPWSVLRSSWPVKNVVARHWAHRRPFKSSKSVQGVGSYVHSKREVGNPSKHLAPLLPNSLHPIIEQKLSYACSKYDRWSNITKPDTKLVSLKFHSQHINGYNSFNPMGLEIYSSAGQPTLSLEQQVFDFL